MHSASFSNLSVLRQNFLDDVAEGFGYEDLSQIESDAVRIRPGSIHFTEAYEGKKFVQIVSIQNCGKVRAFVRIGSPSSFAFTITPDIPRGEYIPPGLNVKRTVKFVYRDSSMVPHANIPIYVNESEVHLKIRTSILCSNLSVDKNIINFEQIDIGPTPTIRYFTMSNAGSKAAKFTIDFSKNDEKIIVAPNKGVINARSSITFSVEIVRYKAGYFDAEFWIKCPSPTRLVVMGESRHGSLEICSSDGTVFNDNAMFDFPVTYYGTKSTKRLLIRNNSSVRGFYCALAELPENVSIVTLPTKPYEEAIKLKDIYSDFSITPSDGRVGPNEAVIITLTYEPKLQYRRQNVAADDDSRFIIFRIKKLSHCKDMNVKDYPGGFYSNSTSNTPPDMYPQDGSLSAINLETTDHSIFSSNVSEDNVVDEVDEISASFKVQTYVRIAALINVETPSVTFIPDEIILHDLVCNEKTVRILQVSNNSNNLPLFLSFVKEHAIDIRPRFISLKPQQCLQFEVYVTPTKIGRVKTRVLLEMLFYNQPRYENDSYVKIDDVSISVTYNTPAVTTTVKGRKGGVTGLPVNAFNCPAEQININRPIQTFDDTYMEASKKPFEKTRSKTYMRMRNERKRMQIMKRSNCSAKSVDPSAIETAMQMRSNVICPLTPVQMNNIWIEPRHLNIGRMAAYSQIQRTFRMINSNNIAISVFIVPEKKRFVFPEGDTLCLAPHHATDIPFKFFSEFEGLHSLCIRIVVNNSHIYEMSMSANVVSRALIVDSQTLTFNSNEPLYKYFDIHNTLNATLSFRWDCSNSSCIVTPVQGAIGAYKDMTCMIEVKTDKEVSSMQDICLITEKINKMSIYVVIKNTKLKMELSTMNVNFKTVALNGLSVQKIVLKNDSNQNVTYKVPNAQVSRGLRLEPTMGTLRSKAIQIFKAYLQSTVSGRFALNANIILNRTDYIQFQMEGNVLMPKIAVSPASIHFKKIADTSFDCASFALENRGKLTSTISFPKKIASEWRIVREPDDFLTISEPFDIPAGGTEHLFLIYSPVSSTNHWFYLPITINHCLGDIEDLSKLRTVTTYMPRSVPHLKVHNVAFESKFEISKSVCNFAHYEYCPELDVTEDVVTFTNNSNEALDFCLRMDEINYNFVTSASESDTRVKCTEFAIVFTIEPNEVFNLNVKYVPLGYGNHSARVAIYLHYDNLQDVHNYISLLGSFQMPLITAPSKVFLGSFPLSLKVAKSVTIQKTYHSPNCNMTFEVDENEELTFEVEHQDQQSVKLRFIYFTSECNVLAARVVAICDCSARCEFTVLANSENSLLTNYAFAGFAVSKTNVSKLNLSKCSSTAEEEAFTISITDLTSTPFYPDLNSILYESADQALLALEDWMFDCVSSGITRHSIPETIRFVQCPAEDNLGPNFYPVIPLVEILQVIAGQSATDQLNSLFPTEFNAFAQCLHCLYFNIITFLNNSGAQMPHVEALYLLDYEEYQVVAKSNDELIFDEAQFNQISKQTWLDILLQTIKLFHVGRITERNSDNISQYNSNLITRSLSNIDIFYKRTAVVDCHLISSKEAILLKWLEYNFFMNVETFQPQYVERNLHRFDNFNSCLADGISMATIVAKYCPYVHDRIQNIYWDPKKYEQRFHNVCKILQILAGLNCSFTIMPAEIMTDNAIKKLLFVTYLYEFLPLLEPNEVIVCEAALSKEASVKISVKNESYLDVEYKVLLFGDGRCFRINKTSLVISPNKVATITVTYFAKFLSTTKCTVLLSGELKRRGLTKSRCYTIKGVPDISQTSSTISAQMQLYNTRILKIDLACPYNSSRKFEIFVSTVAPSGSDPEQSLVPVRQILADQQFMPSEINTFVSSVHFDENNQCAWEIFVIALSFAPTECWYIFRNSDVGDFIVDVRLALHSPKIFENISLAIPKNILQRPCTCSNGPSQRCGRFIKIQIPCKNTMIKRYALEASIAAHQMKGSTFIENLLRSKRGDRIMDFLTNTESNKNHLMSTINKILNEPSMYRVVFQGSGRKSVRCESTIFFKEVTSAGAEAFQLHVDGPLEDSLEMQLISDEKFETRFYKLRLKTRGLSQNNTFTGDTI